MLFSLLFSDYIVFRFIDAVRRDDAADTGHRIYIRAAANDRSRIENAVAAYLNIIAEHRSELFQPRFDFFAVRLYRDKSLVALYVGRYSAGA